MSISIDRSGNRFLLTAGEMSYAFEIQENSRPVNLYWGAGLDRADDLPDAGDRQWHRHCSERQRNNSLQEYPAFGGEYYHECAIKAEYADGVRATRFRFAGSRIRKEPDHEILELLLEEEAHPLTVKLFYRVWPELELIDRWSEIVNHAETPVELENFASAVWQLPAAPSPWRLTHLSGHWGKEAMIDRVPVTTGKVVLESRTGLSGPFAVPFFAIDAGNADELSGEVFFGALHWSGNWKIAVERDPYDRTAVTGGIHDFDNRLRLRPGECFTTPLFSGGWSPAGFSGASRVLHRYQMRHVLPPAVASRPMPVIFNSWGCINIHVNEENILRAARLANRIGAELFVIDDGWQHALGDWFHDPAKFPRGLKPVIDEVRSLGMGFGLWVEIESFELASDLYKKHPEWAMRYPGGEPLTRYRADVNRTSVMLNLARHDVAEYLYRRLHKLISETGIQYLKLDMNCFVSSPGWGELPPEQQGRIWIDYVHNLHWIFERLGADFPELLMENCSSGASRADLAMTRFFGRMNRSDNQDALDVLKLHEGFTMVNPPRMAGGGCHISDSMYHVNHRKTPLQFQAFCGMLGSLACGKDLTQCTEAELQEIRNYTDLYKKLRHVTNFGDLYRLSSHREHPWAAYESVAPDRSEAVVFLLGGSMQFADAIPPLKLAGLNPDALYEITCYGEKAPEGYSERQFHYHPISGRGAARVGIPVELFGDFDCRIFHLKERKR